MIFRTLLEKSCYANRLRGMVGFAARRLMELEIEDPDGAPPMVLVIRIGSINSYRDRIGTRVPARSSAAYSEGSYFPGFLGAAAHGPGRRLPPSSGGLRPERVSTRSVDELVQAMGMASTYQFQSQLDRCGFSLTESKHHIPYRGLALLGMLEHFRLKY